MHKVAEGAMLIVVAAFVATAAGIFFGVEVAHVFGDVGRALDAALAGR